MLEQGLYLFLLKKCFLLMPSVILNLSALHFEAFFLKWVCSLSLPISTIKELYDYSINFTWIKHKLYA